MSDIFDLAQKNITFIVPVHGNGGLFLGRCLESLLDQDWKNKNIIIVYDGEEQLGSALKQKEDFKEDPRVIFTTNNDPKNASKARNYGLTILSNNPVKPDYICFFDCDSILLPGSVSLWIKTFDENPDCGFVYNGYRFNTSQNVSAVVPSFEFDPYLLTCNNYISTMNPIKYDLCPKWDEDLESLQDWDFWLRVTQNGIKGKYINDILIITEEPDEQSISYKGSQNWIERYNKVREKNGIEKRDIAIVTTGARFQSIRRAKILGCDFRDVEMVIHKPHEYKAIISMGYYVDSPCGAYTVFANSKNSKKIVYFIGTDVFQLYDKTYRDIKFFSNKLPNQVDHIFCNAPWLQTELKEMGIESELLYCPIDFNDVKTKPLPEQFTVAFYFSESNPMHLTPILIQVAYACPDIQFKLFGGEKYVTQEGIPENVKIYGHIEEINMNEFINSTSCLLRLTLHDGFPATIAEWAVRLRPSICNIKDMPKCNIVDVDPENMNFVRDKEKIVYKLRELKDAINSDDSMQKMREAREYFRILLDPETFKKRIYEVCL